MTDTDNLQTVLWSASTPLFWKGMSLVATLGSGLLFYTLLKNHEKNALTFARLLWLGGTILAIFIPLNSGMMIWSLAMLVTSGTWMTLLIQSNWCHRRGRFWDKMLAVVRESVWTKKPQRMGDD